MTIDRSTKQTKEDSTLANEIFPEIYHKPTSLISPPIFWTREMAFSTSRVQSSNEDAATHSRECPWTSTKYVLWKGSACVDGRRSILVANRSNVLRNFMISYEQDPAIGGAEGEGADIRSNAFISHFRERAGGTAVCLVCAITKKRVKLTEMGFQLCSDADSRQRTGTHTRFILDAMLQYFEPIK